MASLQLDPKKTALVLIDLQNGIVARQTAPYSPQDVMRNARRLAENMRAKGATVVYVHVNMSDFLPLPVDAPMLAPNAPPPPPEASELAPDAGFQSGDLQIAKRHWEHSPEPTWSSSFANAESIPSCWEASPPI